MGDLLARGDAEDSIQLFEGELFSLREDDEGCELLVCERGDLLWGGMLTEEPEDGAPGGVPAEGALGFECFHQGGPGE